MDDILITIAPDTEIEITVQAVDLINTGEVWSDQLPDLLDVYNKAKELKNETSL